MDNFAYIEDPNVENNQMEPLEDFIIGLFVVVFDTKKGRFLSVFFSIYLFNVCDLKQQ